MLHELGFPFRNFFLLHEDTKKLKPAMGTGNYRTRELKSSRRIDYGQPRDLFRSSSFRTHLIGSARQNEALIDREAEASKVSH